MRFHSTASAKRKHFFIDLGVLAVAGVLAVVSARAHVGAWNDGSRLATVECLVDHHTLAIDQSIFTPDCKDKLLIDGRYYSDKSPVPALLMAGAYQVSQWCFGLSAREQTSAFCYVMTLTFSGLAYVVAVWSIHRLGRTLRLPLALSLALTASFALATVALTYAQYVNNHILLLGVAAALFGGLARLAGSVERGAWSVERGAEQWEGTEKPASSSCHLVILSSCHAIPAGLLFWLGTLTGLGYTIDLGCGPVLLVGVAAIIAYRCRSVRAVAWFGLAAAPWLIVHHAVNYSVGGTFQPANAVPEYLQWPGSPFNPQNMTGTLNHSIGHFFVYALALLFGKRGFFGHNLPLFLFLPALAFLLLHRRRRETPEVLLSAFWCGGTWMAYALTSNNYSGACCSIRWFVPLLAPAYYVLALFLRRYASYRWDFLVLSGWGTVLAGIMWHYGPWIPHMVPLFWPIQGGALLSWFFCRRWRRKMESSSAALPPDAWRRAA